MEVPLLDNSDELEDGAEITADGQKVRVTVLPVVRSGDTSSDAWHR